MRIMMVLENKQGVALLSRLNSLRGLRFLNRSIDLFQRLSVSLVQKHLQLLVFTQVRLFLLCRGRASLQGYLDHLSWLFQHMFLLLLQDGLERILVASNSLERGGVRLQRLCGVFHHGVLLLHLLLCLGARLGGTVLACKPGLGGGLGVALRHGGLALLEGLGADGKHGLRHLELLERVHVHLGHGVRFGHRFSRLQLLPGRALVRQQLRERLLLLHQRQARRLLGRLGCLLRPHHELLVQAGLVVGEVADVDAGLL
mmetsp:Transcript_47434/g.90578  ORF Transcript_47434/g.90578 Transcript_47434/m.90578 type:complete len:257 (+) Transcript_47434:264-1034(+)